MSYGRSPYYIIGTVYFGGDNEGTRMIEFLDPQGAISRGEFPYPTHDKEGKGGAVAVTYEAMAQFIAHLAARGTEELQAWIDFGASLDQDPTGWKATNDSKGLKQERKWLKTEVTVKRKGKVVK